MGEQRQGRSRKRERYVLCVAVVACVLVPLIAKRSLDHKVQDELAATASEYAGLSIGLGHASVGLTGTLEISDIRIGDDFVAKKVIARVTPAFDGSGLSANELVIDSPQGIVTVSPDGSTSLDSLLRRSGNSTVSSEQRSRHRGRIQQLRVINGALHLDFQERGSAWASDINLRLRGRQSHIVVGKTRVDLNEGQWRLTGSIPRAALDYDRSQGLGRLLADGGSFQVDGPRGQASVQDLVLAYGTNAQLVKSGAWQLSARTGLERPTGTVELAVRRTLDGLTATLQAIDAPLLLAGPWLPDSMLERRSTLSGRFSVTHGPTTTAAIDATLSHLRINDARLAKRPLELDLLLRSRMTAHNLQGKRYVDLELQELRSQDVSLHGRLTGQWSANETVPDHASIDLELAEVDCDAALNALPLTLRDSLAGLELRGTMRSRLRLLLSRDTPSATRLEVLPGVDRCKVAREPPAADTESLARGYEHRSPDGRPHLLQEGAAGYTTLKEMPKYLPGAFVAAEDARFFKHKGFDTHQIERSLAIDMERGKLIRGGSTISQQLTKNLFLHRNRTLARKLQEAIITWRLEDNLGKKRILEIYLNIIELGDEHTYGITEASHRWFGLEPSDLSVKQAAFLAALTPEPTSMSARIRNAGALDPVSEGRVGIILRVMRRAKVITSREYRKAKREPLNFASQALATASLLN